MGVFRVRKAGGGRRSHGLGRAAPRVQRCWRGPGAGGHGQEIPSAATEPPAILWDSLAWGCFALLGLFDWLFVCLFFFAKFVCWFVCLSGWPAVRLFAWLFAWLVCVVFRLFVIEFVPS